MTNEMLVERIRNGFSVTENMELLYRNNLPLIKCFIKPYTAYEPMDDLLQEAYFGLWEAVKHYEISKNVLFMTYAEYWIKQSVIRYIEKCGSIVRMPSYMKQRIIRYKKTASELEQQLGRTPSDTKIADKMNISIGLLPELKLWMHDIISLDTPLTEDDNLILADTLQSDLDIENSAIDKLYDEHSKSELWGIVERYTNDRESDIIKDYFINNKSMHKIAQERGLTTERIRIIKEDGLHRLRMGKARRELLEKFDIVESALYRSGMKKYREHDHTSTVEYIALRKAEIQAEYEEQKKQFYIMLERSKRACL